MLIGVLATRCSGGQAAHAESAGDMIVHRREADKALSAGTPHARPLAERLKAAQDPEMATMSGWLRKWGEDVPAEDAGSHHAMPGMASAEELASLEKPPANEADRLFLTLMIKHHEGAVEMSRDQQRSGRERSLLLRWRGARRGCRVDPWLTSDRRRSTGA